jgi:D-beta-D-heptose 7-phosphate kinase/D-beta-D-heptose 1-phosphate adenosyltransferase
MVRSAIGYETMIGRGAIRPRCDLFCVVEFYFVPILVGPNMRGHEPRTRNGHPIIKIHIGITIFPIGVAGVVREIAHSRNRHDASWPGENGPYATGRAHLNTLIEASTEWGGFFLSVRHGCPAAPQQTCMMRPLGSHTNGNPPMTQDTAETMDRPATDRELADIVRHFPTARVLVIGDIILDRYVVGSVQRLSPEAPIPVLRPSVHRATLGGAANVAMNIATLGGQATLVGVIGNDEAGGILRDLVAKATNLHAALVTVPGRPTTSKTRFMTGSHQLLRLDEETTAPLASTAATDVLGQVRLGLEHARVVVLSDYAKGVLCDDVLAEVIAMARATGRIVIADPKRADFTAYRGATILTPNEHEVRVATRIEADHDAEADRAGRAALDATAGEAVLVTRSAKGLTLVRRDCPAMHLPTRAREVADVSGAGDALVAALAVALATGAKLPAASMLANANAGISVGKQGTATVSRQELLDSLHLDDLVANDRKVATIEEAAAVVSAWHAKGFKVGFANGCFDLIHPGHVRLLSEARAACDRLIVALNTDASVQRLKGPTRPVQNETARATVMASLAPVDMVILFNEDTPLDAIRALRPDVLVKGSDYTIDQVVGGDLVQGWGGKVVLVTLEEGHSTTGTIRRMTAPG